MDLQGSFWTSNLANTIATSSETISSLLQDQSIGTLKSLLLDSDILQECKSNPALIYFLSKPEVIADLITMIVCGSSDPDSQDERLAYVASEIIACEVFSVIDAIFASQDAMAKLFSLVAARSPEDSLSPLPLDARRAGHFRKVVAVMIQHRYKELADYIEAHPDIISGLISHIANTSILEVLIMLGWDDGNPDYNYDRKWLFDLKFIPAIVKLLQLDQSEHVHINAAHGLIDMVLKCPRSPTTCLVNHLSSPSVLTALINNCLSGSASAYENGLSVLSIIVQRHVMLHQDLQEDQLITEEIPHPVQLILNMLPDVFNFVVNSPFPDPIPSPMSGTVQPLGAPRLKAAELLLAFLRSGYEQALVKITETHFIPVVISYFFQFKWNSMLHFIVEAISCAILDAQMILVLQQEFLQRGKFVEQAMQMYEENQMRFEASRNSVRFGNMGHIIRILNFIIDLSVQKPEIQSLIHPDLATWLTFVETTMKVENERLLIQLGGFKPHSEQSGTSSGQQDEYASLPPDDGFASNNDVNFHNDANSDQAQAMFNLMNTPESSFDNDAWPAISFDDQDFEFVDNDNVFGEMTSFSTQDSIVVDSTLPNEDAGDK